MRPNFWNNLHNSSSSPHSTQSTPNNTSSSASSSVQQHFGHQRQRHESGQSTVCVPQLGQGTPPPAVVLFPDGGGPNGGIPNNNNISPNRMPNRISGQPTAFLVRNSSVDMQTPEIELFSGNRNCGGSSRSPSATSLASNGGGGIALTTNTLGTISPHYCSPNPSPPPGAQSAQSTPKYGPTRVQNAGSASVARMMSALLKQQNSIAEEEPETLGMEMDEQPLLIGRSNSMEKTTMANGTPPGTATLSISYHESNQQQKCWLAPPDHTLLGGSISPPPTRIHPIQDPELRKELSSADHQNMHGHQFGGSELGRHIVALANPIATGPASPASASVHQKQIQHENSGKRDRKESGGSGRGWNRQQSQPWPNTGRGATSKHRKGSLSPNNSLRYSTLMAAATRRNHFQQQRTTSEASPTPAQRDQLMADVLG